MDDGGWEMGTPRIENVEQMPVYQAFLALALEVEKATRNSGPDFRWLRVQMLRSSESVCANMAEGFYSQYSTEYLQALYRCRREGRETVTHIAYAGRVTQLPEAIVVELQTRYKEALRQLANVITSIERKIQERGKSKPGSIVKETGIGYAIEMSDDEND
jgi:four helix bundle protein